MERKNINEKLKELLEAHDVNYIEREDWVAPYGRLPVINMYWYPNYGEWTGLLQVKVFIEEDLILEESFAGVGDGQEGENDGVNIFCLNSFHVLLAAFWNKIDPEQVETEKWVINGQDYVIFIGPFGTRGRKEYFSIPDELFKNIENAIKHSKCEGKYNWFRIYFCNTGNKDFLIEALHNNQFWKEGDSCLRSIEWIKSDKFYTIRNFLIAVKVS